MKLTPAQLRRFWSKSAGWPAVVAAHNWSPAEAESQRKAMLNRCGFFSLTEVDPGAGFTAVLKEISTLLDNLDGMLSADANKRRQKIWLIRRVPTAYWKKIAQDRYHTDDLETLKDWQIDQLLYTVSDRQVAHTAATKVRRSVANHARRHAAATDPEKRIIFHLPDQLPDVGKVISTPIPESNLVSGPF